MLSGRVFVYELNSCGFEFRCSYQSFRYRDCFEQGVIWHSECRFTLNKMHIWHDKNIQWFTSVLIIAARHCLVCYSFLLPPTSSPPRTSNLSLDTSTAALMFYLLLNSEPSPGKSTESNNHHWKAPVKLFFFVTEKNKNNRQALHQIFFDPQY